MKREMTYPEREAEAARNECWWRLRQALHAHREGFKWRAGAWTRRAREARTYRRQMEDRKPYLDGRFV